jgi:hypothetical protein
VSQNDHAAADRAPIEPSAAQTLIEVRCLVENLHDILSLPTETDAVQRLAAVTSVVGDLATILGRPALVAQAESSPIAS